MNESGEMIQKYWMDLEKGLANICLHDFVVMPNHFHGIIEINNGNKQCDCKLCRGTPCGYPDIKRYEKYIVKNYFKINVDNNDRINPEQGTHKGCPYNRNMIGNIIGGFKSKTTHQYIKNVNQNNWLPFNKKLWQRNYYEHIIRSEKSYIQIVEYINNNPTKWDEDKFYNSDI